MKKEDYTSYFGTYAHKNPEGEEYYNKQEIKRSELSEKGLQEWVKKSKPKCFELVNKYNYPKLYQAIVEECRDRHIDMPECYIDKTGSTRPGAAHKHTYSFDVGEEAYDIMSEKELRALVAHEIKHLYQATTSTIEQSLEHEKDCDRSAIESVGYKTVVSYVGKAANIYLKDQLKSPDIPLKDRVKFKLGLIANSVFPRLIAENYNVQLDEYHPSPAARMSAMKKYAREIGAIECGIFDIRHPRQQEALEHS